MIQTTNRFFGAAIAAASVTAALFWTMTALIRVPDTQIYPEALATVVLDVHVEPADEPIVPRRPRPKREPVTDPEPLPPITKGKLGPGIALVGRTAPGPFIKKGPGNMTMNRPDGDAVPLVRVPPQYPARAMARGVEGRVLIDFTISRIGTVENARIVAFEPTSVFNQAALEAVQQWRYEPKRVNGKAVPQPGQRIVIPFKKGDHGE